MPRFLCLVLALSVLLVAPPAFSQSAVPSSFASTLSGTKYPLSLTLKDLDGSWRMFSLTPTTDTSSQLNLYVAALTGGLQSTYYTKGETVSLNGELYVVAYHQKITLDLATLLKGENGGLPPVSKLTPDTVLFLSLLNLRLTGSLNDIRAFSLADALNPPVVAQNLEDVSVSNLKQVGLAIAQYT